MRRQYFNDREERRQRSASDIDHMDEDTSTVGIFSPSAQQQVWLAINRSDTDLLHKATIHEMPERPKKATDDVPFECPLCYHMIMASDDRSWREHFYGDLLPYVCLHEVCGVAGVFSESREWISLIWIQDCTGSAHLYAHLDDWQRHMESHERHWLCPYGCSDTFGSKEGFSRHLEMEHLVDEPMIATLCMSRPIKPTQNSTRACTLCKQPITTSGSGFWFDHVGDHLRQLALFALPSHVLSRNPDNDRDAVSSTEYMPTHSADAKDAREPMPHRGFMERRLSHEDMDLDDTFEYLSDDDLFESRGQAPKDESRLMAYSLPTSSPQEHVTDNKAGPPSLVANRGKYHRCPYCSTSFRRPHHLKTHLLTHSVEKPHVCQTCDARFRRLHDLKRHTKLHTGVRPCICGTCGRRFARADALARHTNPVCAGRRSIGEDEFFGTKSMDETYDPKDDLDMYEAIDDLDSGDPMSAGRKIKFPKIEDL